MFVCYFIYILKLFFFFFLHSGARIEEFIYDKLDKKLPSKTTNAELLGHYMLDAASEFGADTPYGQ